MAVNASRMDNGVLRIDFNIVLDVNKSKKKKESNNNNNNNNNNDNKANRNKDLSTFKIFSWISTLLYCHNCSSLIL